MNKTVIENRMEYGYPNVFWIRHWIVFVLLVGFSGQAVGHDVDDDNLGTMKKVWNSACTSGGFCIDWWGDVHSPMTEKAYDIAKHFTSIPSIIDDVDEINDWNSKSEYLQPNHFTRNGSQISSRRACERNRDYIIDRLWNSCVTYNIGKTHGYSDYYRFAKQWFGFAIHTLQDSTCPAHARRYKGNYPYYRKLETMCVSGGQQVPTGSCSHDNSLDAVNNNWEVYAAGVRATAGVIIAFSNFFGSSGCSFDFDIMRDVLTNYTDIYSGYLDCSSLSTTDMNCYNPKKNCDGYCVNTSSSENNCGYCGNRCSWSKDCIGGVCKDNPSGCTSDSQCPQRPSQGCGKCLNRRCINVCL